MQVIKSGKFYKASRITGPAHSFLGLALTQADIAGGIHVEKLSASGDTSPMRNLDFEQVVAKVFQGVSQANAELGTDFHVETVQYVPTDSDDLDAYLDLAKRIVREAARTAAETAASPRGSALA